MIYRYLMYTIGHLEKQRQKVLISKGNKIIAQLLVLID